ncbi:patatin-like phospholipase family protein [Comamonas faecalis]|uniref:Patatin-like phospholipase family protein n=1 Tax=Comamonas faecalis TaxID=1387849 RepID=A0ABP7RHS2_9BURK
MLATLPPVATPPTDLTALVLTGGGARAAYQVGVLEAIADLRRACGAHKEPNPFPIYSGTSAGAINAAALASGADNFDHAVRRMVRVWSHFEAHHVYHTDSISMLRSGARWLTLLSMGWVLARWRYTRPRSLLDNTPLAELLARSIALARLPRLLQRGHLHALAITASSYSSGDHITFFDASRHLQPWVRSQRRAVQQRITHQHLLASSAIPFIFPAAEIDMGGHGEYFGDGSMRQTAPIAPAIHLGASRVLVIGASRMHEPAHPPTAPLGEGYPSLAQIAGHTLSSIFLDSLSVDVERLRRINHTLSLVPPQAQGESRLRPVELLLISPTQRLDMVAARHVACLPAPVRALLAPLGVAAHSDDPRSAALASYLLFQPSFTHELMALGRADALARRSEICAFFGWCDPDRAQLPPLSSAA